MTQGDPHEFLEGLRSLRRNDFGRHHALTVEVSVTAISQAAHQIALAGVVELIEQWMIDDKTAARKGPGGRPPVFSVRSIMVAMQALTVAHGASTLRDAYNLLTRPMTRDVRDLLGLPTSDDKTVDKWLDDARTEFSYNSVTRRFHAISLTIDPQPFTPTSRALTQAEANKIAADRDPAWMGMRLRRAQILSNRMLHVAYKSLPKNVQDTCRGNITLDATPIPVWGKHGNRSTRRVAGEATLSPEVNAGWYARERDQRDVANLPGAKPHKDWKWANDLHVGVLTTRDTDPMPPLIMGMSLDTPGRSPGQNAVHLLAGIPEAGLPVGTVTVDLGYSMRSAHNFALPVRALGYELNHMFQRKQLGETLAHHKDLVLVEGTWYGPCLPDVLRYATRDYVEHRIDQATFEARIESRRAYAARLKTKTPTGDVYIYRCPGAGSGRTVNCPHKPATDAQQQHEVRAERLLPLLIDPPSKAHGNVCSLRESVSVPIEKSARYLTKYPYMTPEWRRAYGPARNEMEGRNGYLKTTGTKIADAAQRRYRGWGKQFLALMMKLVAANVHALITWIDNQEPQQAPPPTRRGRKPRNVLQQYVADPNGPPRHMIGFRIPTNPGEVA